MGISTMRCLPPKGTAGFERSLVSGYNLVPLPPPRIIDNTLTTQNSSVNSINVLYTLFKKKTIFF